MPHLMMVSHGRLTKREMELILLLAKGYTTRDAAKEMYVTESTAKTHLMKAKRRYAAKTTPQLIYRMMRMGHLL